MKHFAAVFVAVLALALITPATGQDEVARGKELYKEQKCRMCHNLGGVGNSKGATLDGVGSKHDPEALRMWLTDPKEMAQKAGSTRKPPMKSYAKLPPADLDALVAYLATLKTAG